MALIKCKECDKPVSDTAELCPNCGSKVSKPTSRLAIGVAGLFAIGIAASLFNTPSRAPEPVASKSPTQVAADAKKESQFQLVLLGAQALKQSMKNPDTFKLESAVMMDDGAICYEYRGTNSFNAVVPEQIVITEKGAKKDAATWNKRCAHKTGNDFSFVKTAM